MRNEIIAALKQLEVENECRILFAAESGSRAWGFASPDSDYDVRAIYVKSNDWYLCLDENQKDTFDVMLPGDLDISAWELRKALRLFAGCNLPLNEWLGSPVQYFADTVFYSRFKEMLPQYFNPIKAVHHYLAIKNKAMDDLDKENSIRIKKLFYAMRGLFAAMWCVEKQTMPPTEFQKILDADLLPGDILPIVGELQIKKQIAAEKERIQIPARLADFLLLQDAILIERSRSLTVDKVGNAQLSQLLRDYIIW